MNIRGIGNAGVLFGTFLFSWPLGAAGTAGVGREVRSPDGKIALTIHTDAPLGYSITVDGMPVLLRSRLGLELAGDVKPCEKPVVQSEARKSANKQWINEFGKNRNVRDYYNELTIALRDGERHFGVVARAYDDGEFLGKGDWKVTLWQDAPDSGQNAEDLVKNERTVHGSDTLQLKLAPAGGTVAIFSPVK